MDKSQLVEHSTICFKLSIKLLVSSSVIDFDNGEQSAGNRNIWCAIIVLGLCFISGNRGEITISKSRP